MKRLVAIIILFLITAVSIYPQKFGQNRVHYKEYNWEYIQTKHFDIYFGGKARQTVEFLAKIAEQSLNEIESVLKYQINNRITIILYNSHNDFQETNVSDNFIGQGIGGFTESFKNRVVIPFEGSYKTFRHVINHELTHAVMNDMLYGGTVQNIISKGITLRLPLWYNEGMAEYLSIGWNTNEDMFIRDAIINEYLPNISQLNGYFAYRGGQSIFEYIAKTYGRPKVGELLNKIKDAGNLDQGLKATLGISLKELNRRWKKSLKVEYWPEIASMQEPDVFAKRLTNNKKTRGFYNTSPAISPQGDKVVFISDRDIYLNVYEMNLANPKEVKLIVHSGTTNNFEELNLLFPSLTWAPDNYRIALASKSAGFDAIDIIDTRNGKVKKLPIHLESIKSVAWSPNGKMIAFVGATANQSDIYIYYLDSKKLENLTSDIFSDSEPVWAPNSKIIYFSSDRGKYLHQADAGSNFDMLKINYKQLDIYSINVDTKNVVRITNWELSTERSPVVSPDGKEILFISDYNGINNIYKKRVVLTKKDTVKSVAELKAVPITNSLNEISELTLSKDGKRLVFSTLYDAGYNLFLMKDPFSLPSLKKLKVTPYMTSLLAPHKKIDTTKIIGIKTIPKSAKIKNSILTKKTVQKQDTTKQKIIFATGEIINQDTSTVSKNKYTNYIFGSINKKTEEDTLAARRKRLFSAKLDKNGNFLIHKYKVTFSPDIVYANAGFSSLYGLLGTTVLSFSDMLGNHRLIGTTSMQMDLKNSDYGLAYYYLGKRTNFGVEFFHTARFVLLYNNYRNDLYRFQNFGGILSARYPFSRFYRIDAGLSVLDVSSENLDDFTVPMSKNTFFIPTVSFVHDNTLWGYTSPIDGTRYNLTLFGSPGIASRRQSFYSFTWDYRHYFRFWFDNAFVFRISGGYSSGANPQRFFLGGTSNWINRTFATGEIPLKNASDFAFLSPAMPLRGYDYAQQIGTKYSLLNLELRMPIIRYLLTSPLPLLFQNILGTAFIDAGTAWDNNRQLKLFGRTPDGTTVTKHLLIGTGFGARVYFIFLWKFDVAWAYNLQRFSKPKFYISMGLDF